MLHFPIFLADCDYRGAMQFDTFCQSKKSQVFIQSYNLLLLQRLLKFLITDNTVWPISSFQKKKIKLRSNGVVLHKTFIQELYVLNHIVSIFIKSCILFSIYTILNKFESGTIRVDPSNILSFLKNDQFLWKAHIFRITLYFPTYLETLDQDIIQY